jgi:hypothetical protein
MNLQRIAILAALILSLAPAALASPPLEANSLESVAEIAEQYALAPSCDAHAEASEAATRLGAVPPDIPATCMDEEQADDMPFESE